MLTLCHENYDFRLQRQHWAFGWRMWSRLCSSKKNSCENVLPSSARKYSPKTANNGSWRRAVSITPVIASWAVLAWVAANLSVIPAAAADLCRSDNDGHLIHSVTWRRRMTGARRTCSDKPQPHDIWFVFAYPKNVIAMDCSVAAVESWQRFQISLLSGKETYNSRCTWTFVCEVLQCTVDMFTVRLFITAVHYFWWLINIRMFFFNFCCCRFIPLSTIA